ncbi:MAG: isochorismatase family protein [Actinomycetota bacterium]|nr:isochorismatase family protein [Actinomycetota bacterium]
MPRYDDNTALIVIDVQNDFADPRGSLYVRGGEQVVPVINDEIGTARRAGSPVFYTQDWHPESTPHFQKDGGIWPVHCVQGTWGAELHPDLEVSGDIVQKGTDGQDGYSGFTVRDPRSGATTETQLEPALINRGVQRVVVVGLATDYCVKETVLDAVEKGFATTVLLDAIRPVDLEEGDGERAVQAMRAAGAEIV